ncbi:MAG: hypothetical protein HY269_05140, partial [Deltaproteobacteria bacterium]|nr:hypothetical protein [Deltaproteobacteria bacterium]
MCKVDLHIMIFAFTDEEVADALTTAARQNPSMQIRILADWNQRTEARGQQVNRLAKSGLSNLHVRYKADQPYMWDSAVANVRWNYHVSRGLLHHKTAIVLVDGHPRKLVCGSFNWTGTATRSYEHVLLADAREPDCKELIVRVALEFEAIWSDGRASLSPIDAEQHYLSIVAAFRRNPTISPSAIRGLEDAQGEPLHVV